MHPHRLVYAAAELRHGAVVVAVGIEKIMAHPQVAAWPLDGVAVAEIVVVHPDAVVEALIGGVAVIARFGNADGVVELIVENLQAPFLLEGNLDIEAVAGGEVVVVNAAVEMSAPLVAHAPLHLAGHGIAEAVVVNIGVFEPGRVHVTAEVVVFDAVGVFEKAVSDRHVIGKLHHHPRPGKVFGVDVFDQNIVKVAQVDAPVREVGQRTFQPQVTHREPVPVVAPVALRVAVEGDQVIGVVRRIGPLGHGPVGPAAQYRLLGPRPLDGRTGFGQGRRRRHVGARRQLDGGPRRCPLAGVREARERGSGREAVAIGIVLAGGGDVVGLGGEGG